MLSQSLLFSRAVFIIISIKTHMIDLLIVTRRLGIGGNATSTINLYKALNQHIKVKIVAVDGSDYKFRNLNENEFVDLHFSSSKSKLARIFSYVSKKRELKKIIEKYQPKYLYLIINPYFNIVKYGKINARTIISCRDFGMLTRKHALYKKNLSKSDAMVTNSLCLKDFYLNLYPSDNEKVVCINNIVNVEEIKTQSLEKIDDESLKFFDNHRVIVAVGRFCVEKGFNHLIRAFLYAKKSIPNLGLCIVGDGEFKPKIEKMIAKNGCENDILLSGYKANPHCFVAKSEAYVLSSISEGFPNVVLEALALNKPIIAADCKSGPREILAPDDANYLAKNDAYQKAKFGILCPPLEFSDDYLSTNPNFVEQEMGKAIVELLTNKDLYYEFVDNSKTVLTRFSSENIASEYIELLKKL